MRLGADVPLDSAFALLAELLFEIAHLALEIARASIGRNNVLVLLSIHIRPFRRPACGVLS